MVPAATESKKIFKKWIYVVSKMASAAAFSSDILCNIRDVIGAGQHGLHEPRFDQSDLDEVGACIGSGFVSSFGPANTAFESALCTYSGARNAVAVVNGTAAIQLSLEAFGFQKGAEVLVPAMTFVATANAVKHAGLIPHFVDSDVKDLGVDIDKLAIYLQVNCTVKNGNCMSKRTGNPIVAIVPVHVFGHVGDMRALKVLAEEYHLTIIEDAAEALGSWRDAIHTGLFGYCGALSFNGNKIITTGGGGAILCDDSDFANRLRHLSTTAKVQHIFEYDHDALGFNFRMANLNAALGLAQMAKLDNYIALKRHLTQRYIDTFATSNVADFFVPPIQSKSNNWLNAIMLCNEAVPYRDEILMYLNEQGLGCRPVWKLLPYLSHFADCPRMDLSNAIDLHARLINIPSSPHLGEAVLRGE